MKILIDIPKEFEVDYNTDRFANFFQRCLADMGTSCGNYEQETAEMMEKAFEKSRLYDTDKVVKQLEKKIQTHKRAIEYEKKNGTITEEFQQRKAVEVLEGAIEIVKGEYVTEQSCEWKLEDVEQNLYVTECVNRHLIFEGTPEENGYKYCPYCGRKIKRGGVYGN